MKRRRGGAALQKRTGRALRSLGGAGATAVLDELARAGLTVRRTWGNFDGSNFSMHSPRMIVLAEKASWSP